MSGLRREQDFYELTLAYLTRVCQDGVRHAEVFLGTQSFTQTGVPIEVIMNGVLSALHEGEKSCHMTTGFLVSAHRHRPEADALALLESVRPWYEQIAGFGLGGAERGNPPTKFRLYFAQAQRLGFKTTIHAGEEGPVDYCKAGTSSVEG
jgi:adenosine deaminase